MGTAGLFLAYKGYVKYQVRQNQEFRYEGTLGRAPDGFKLEMFKEFVLADAILDAVISEMNLVEVWGSGDAEAAKKRIREKFNVTMEDYLVKVSYQDRNKQIAHDLLHFIVQRYRAKMEEAGSPQKRLPDNA